MSHSTSWQLERGLEQDVSHRRAKRHDVETWKYFNIQSNPSVFDIFPSENALKGQFHIVATRATGRAGCFTSSRQTPRCGNLKTPQYPVKSECFWHISKWKSIKRPNPHRGDSSDGSSKMFHIVAPNATMRKLEITSISSQILVFLAYFQAKTH